MKKKLVVVPASYEILSRLDDKGIARGLEYCGRICYKSENKITADSSEGFCRKMAREAHNSTLEMRVKTFIVEMPVADVDLLLKTMPKYLIIDDITSGSLSSDIKEMLITGSVRGFREMVMLYPNCVSTSMIAQRLEKKYPFLFEDIDSEFRNVDEKHYHISHCPLKTLEIADWLSSDQFLRHRHIAVKFIVNRAVTHEIVRHRPCSFLQESQRYCRYSQDKFGNRVTFVEPAVFFETNSEEYAQWQKAMLVTEDIYLNLLKTSTPQAARTVLPNSCKTEIIVFANLVEWNHIMHMRTSKAAEPSMREVMIPLQKDFQQMFSGVSFDRRFPENFA